MGKESKAKHLQARVKFLDQASRLIAEQQFSSTSAESSISDIAAHDKDADNLGLAVFLGSHLRKVAKRSQVRIDKVTKRRVCKVCSTPQLENKSAITTLENSSTGRSKPWADVETITCLNCGTQKRFPTGARRQLKRAQRLGRIIDEGNNATLNATDVQTTK